MLWLPFWAQVKAVADAATTAAAACLTKANNLSDLANAATARTNLGLGSLATVSSLTGPITSTGAATAVASQTGTGSTFAMSAGPTFTGTVTTAALTTTGLFDISGASAGQIKFPATQNPSADANTLDDYEEGTFTPSITFGTPGTFSASYNFQSGDYTKAGRLVVINFSMVTSAFTIGTASGNLLISGAPFTSASGTNHFWSAGLGEWQGITKASYTDLGARIPASSASISVLANGSGQSAAFVGAADMTPIGGTVALMGSLSYNV